VGVEPSIETRFKKPRVLYPDGSHYVRKRPREGDYGKTVQFSEDLRKGKRELLEMVHASSKCRPKGPHEKEGGGDTKKSGRRTL